MTILYGKYYRREIKSHDKLYFNCMFSHQKFSRLFASFLPIFIDRRRKRGRDRRNQEDYRPEVEISITGEPIVVHHEHLLVISSA